MADEAQELPTLGIASSDLRVIDHVLIPYTKGVSNSSPLSPKRDALLQTIENLRVRIAAMKSATVGGGEQRFPLTYDELNVIDCAFTAFVDNMRQDVPQSTERDEIIRGCEALRVSIVSGCTQ